MDSGLEEVLKDWHPVSCSKLFWNREIEIPKPQSDFVHVIQGVRRCGKSTLMGQLIAKWGLDPGHCYFLNFEDSRLVDKLNTDFLERVYQTVKADHKDVNIYIFLDEIQLVPHWQKWLRLRVDRSVGDCFIVSGSNASLLSGEFSTVLTGRHRFYELFPFSYAEYKVAFPKANLVDYIKRGGFPRVLRDEQPRILLQQYFKDITEKDLRERLKARSSLQVQRLMKMAYESCGSETSLRKLAAKVDLSTDTVGSYLEAAESAYLTFACPYFAYSERRAAFRNKKYYAIDTGLRRSVITTTGQDLGKDFENVVFLALRRKFSRVCYWKGKNEVDFVVETEKGLLPIQVTIEQPKERHNKALDEFFREFPDAQDPWIVNLENFEDFVSCL